jgi:hypothetical protein
MKQEPNYHQADIELVDRLKKLDTNLGELPEPKPPPWAEKPNYTAHIVVGLVLIALALIVIFNF